MVVCTDDHREHGEAFMETASSHVPLASIGIDIGKEVFHIVGFGTDGRIAFRRKIKRLALIDTFKKLPSCIVGPVIS
jgi:hypothetical protein